MAGRSSRVQARRYKHNQARKRQEATLRNMQINANYYKVLEGAGRPPTSGRYSGRGMAPRSGQTGWGYDGYVKSTSRSGETWGQNWFYQYRKGVPNVTIGRRTYGPGLVDAKVYYTGEDDWKRKINAAYWSSKGQQEAISQKQKQMSGWKAFDESTVGSSRGMGGSRLGTSSSVVSVGGGYASGSAVAGNVTGNVGQIAARIESEGLVLGTDSSGKGVYVRKSQTESSKAVKKGTTQYGSGFSTGFESTPDKSFAVDAQGKKYTSWDELKQQGRQNKIKQSKEKGGSLHKATEFISAYEREFGIGASTVTASQTDDYFDKKERELATRKEALLASTPADMWGDDGKLLPRGQINTTLAAVKKVELSSIADKEIGIGIARARFQTSEQRLARAQEINASAIEQQIAKKEIAKYLPEGSNYLNPEQYSTKLEQYKSQERNIRGTVGSAYRELLYGEDIRLDTTALQRDASGLKQVDQYQFRNVSQQEQMFAIDDRKDNQGRQIVYDAKQLEGIKKSRQRGQIQYELPDGKQSIDPALQRGRVRKVYYRTKQAMPEYREAIKTKRAELESLRQRKEISTEQYQSYLKQIEDKTQYSVDVYNKSGGGKIHFDDSFGTELRQFGTKRKQLHLDIAIAETEIDALEKNVKATDEELERLKKMKTKMGGDGMAGGGGRMVNPARIKIAQAKRGYGSAIMSQGERAARRSTGVSGGNRRQRRQMRFEARGLVVGEQGGKRPNKNKFAFDVLRSLERERKRLIG